VNILKENDLIVNGISTLNDEMAIDDTVPVCPELDDFSDFDCIPYTFARADCCGEASANSIRIDPCMLSDNKDLQAELDCQGRLLTIRVILKNVCPNKKIAIGVLLFEGTTVKGFKVKEIVTPPLLTRQTAKHCENVVVCKFCFVLPGTLCCPITLTPKVIAHYTNFNISPC
jgi:hypothetical protein